LTGAGILSRLFTGAGRSSSTFDQCTPIKSRLLGQIPGWQKSFPVSSWLLILAGCATAQRVCVGLKILAWLVRWRPTNTSFQTGTCKKKRNKNQVALQIHVKESARLCWQFCQSDQIRGSRTSRRRILQAPGWCDKWPLPRKHAATTTQKYLVTGAGQAEEDAARSFRLLPHQSLVNLCQHGAGTDTPAQ
jgi:hypothetical protein